MPLSSICRAIVVGWVALLALNGCSSPAQPAEPWGPEACYSAKDPRSTLPGVRVSTLDYIVLDSSFVFRPPKGFGDVLLPAFNTTGTISTAESGSETISFWPASPYTYEGKSTEVMLASNEDGPPWVSLLDLPVALRQDWAPIPNSEPDAGFGLAIVARNASGELLFARIIGSFRDPFADWLPELRIAKGVSLGDSTVPCQMISGRYDEFTSYEVRLSTDVESKSVPPFTTVAISVGCVDYLVSVGYAEELQTRNCFSYRDMLYVFVIRRSLLADPNSFPPKGG